jgi:hypothetical protein
MKNNEEGLCHAYPGDNHANLSRLSANLSWLMVRQKGYVNGPDCGYCRQGGKKTNKKKVMKKRDSGNWCSGGRGLDNHSTVRNACHPGWEQGCLPLIRGCISISFHQDLSPSYTINKPKRESV